MNKRPFSFAGRLFCTDHSPVRHSRVGGILRRGKTYYCITIVSQAGNDGLLIPCGPVSNKEAPNVLNLLQVK